MNVPRSIAIFFSHDCIGRIAIIVLVAGAMQTSRAQDAVDAETLIRSDSVIAALDRTLNEVYGQAMSKARDRMDKTLKAEQRGWIKDRDACWKADRGEEYLTASWVARSTRECIEGKYRLRIAELQALWQLVPSDGPFFYGCDGDPRNEIVLTSYASLLPTVRLERGDRTVLAWQTPAAGNGTYEGPDVTVVRTEKGITVRWRDETFTCAIPND